MAKDAMQRLREALQYAADVAKGKYGELTGGKRRSPVSLPTDETHRTAVHEAGHALCAWASQGTTTLASLSVSPGIGGRAYTRKNNIYRDSPFTFWEDASISLGGIAAEGLVYGGFRSGESETDLEHALAAAELLREAESRSGKTIPPPWKEASLRTSIDIGAMYRHRPHDRTVAVLNASYRRSKSVVSTHHRRLSALARELAATKQLYETDIMRILGPRPWALR